MMEKELKGRTSRGVDVALVGVAFGGERPRPANSVELLEEAPLRPAPSRLRRLGLRLLPQLPVNYPSISLPSKNSNIRRAYTYSGSAGVLRSRVVTDSQVELGLIPSMSAYRGCFASYLRSPLYPPPVFCRTPPSPFVPCPHPVTVSHLILGSPYRHTCSDAAPSLFHLPIVPFVQLGDLRNQRLAAISLLVRIGLCSGDGLTPRFPREDFIMDKVSFAMLTSGFAVSAPKTLPGAVPYNDGVMGERMGDFGWLDDILWMMMEGTNRVRWLQNRSVIYRKDSTRAGGGSCAACRCNVFDYDNEFKVYSRLLYIGSPDIFSLELWEKNFTKEQIH